MRKMYISCVTLVLLLLPYSICANGNKEYQVTDLLRVDDFEKELSEQAIKAIWNKYTDKDAKTSVTIKTNETPGYNDSKHCMHILWKMDPYGKNSWAGATRTLVSLTKGLDLTGYYGIRFYAKGKGKFSVRLAIPATMKESNFHKTLDMYLYPDWQVYELPFSQFSVKWGTSHEWDPSNVIYAEWGVDSQNIAEGDIFLDDVSFYKVKEVERKVPDTKDNSQPVAQLNKANVEQMAGKRVAVVGVESQEIDKKVANAMIDFIINAYVNDGSLKVVDRNSIEKILDEQAFQSKDFTDTAKMIKIGKISGADFISIGSISKVGGMYYLNIKLISVQSAEILGSSISTAQDDSGFFMMTNEAVNKLFKR